MEENKQVVAEWKALNKPRLQEIKKANPDLYSAVNLALQYLNQKLGGEELPQEIEEIEEVVESTPMQTKKWTLDDFKDIKIFVNTPEKSKRFQELFLSLGGKWSAIDVRSSDDLRKVNNTDKKYLLTTEGVMLYYDTDQRFQDADIKEIFYDDIFSGESETTTVAEKAGQWRMKTKEEFNAEGISNAKDFSAIDPKFVYDNYAGKYLVDIYDSDVMSLSEAEDRIGKTSLYLKQGFTMSDSKFWTQKPLPSVTESTSQNKYRFNIETYPDTFPFVLPALSANTGDRKSPTQSAGALKAFVSKTTGEENINYTNLMLTTKFKGNDGNWYRINVGKNGIWTWKEATPPPMQSISSEQTVSTPIANYKPEDLIGREIFSKGNYKILGIIKVNPKTIVYRTTKNSKEVELVIPKTAIGDFLEGKIVGKAFLKDLKAEVPAQPSSNNDLLKMTDAELLKLYDEIEEAKNELDASDPEYTELRLKQIEVSNELDKRN